MHSPLEQFQIHRLANFNLYGFDVSFNNSALFMVIAALLVTLLMAVGARAGVGNNGMVPTRLQAVAEIYYNFLYQMVRENAGEKAAPYFPFVFTMFSFILLGNMVGMVPYSFTFTSHIIVTFTLALMVFLVSILAGVWHHKWHFLQSFFPPGAPVLLAPLLVPIEILSFLSRPISLSIRLFANMMAGHTMMKVFAGFAVSMGWYAVAPVSMIFALTGFEILVAFLQAYVFAVLTCLYLRFAIELH
ncbi:MAG: F0F1 ATP synthase subunit A [Alphaproteobacteria bacterium]|nr:F0F1 ATP synthase subunit A [Alphaproteobacteria bacterium]